MGNPMRGEVEIVLDKERTLRLDLNAMVVIEEAIGKPFQSLSQERFTLKDVRAILWGLLRHEDRKITQEDVGGWVTMDKLPYIQERIQRCFEVGTAGLKPDDNGGNVEGAVAKMLGTGVGS